MKSSEAMILAIMNCVKKPENSGLQRGLNPAPNVSGFIGQLVRASHRYRGVTGSNPVEVLNFSGFFTQFIIARIIASLNNNHNKNLHLYSVISAEKPIALYYDNAILGDADIEEEVKEINDSEIAGFCAK